MAEEDRLLDNAIIGLCLGFGGLAVIGIALEGRRWWVKVPLITAGIVGIREAVGGIRDLEKFTESIR